MGPIWIAERDNHFIEIFILLMPSNIDFYLWWLQNIVPSKCFTTYPLLTVEAQIDFRIIYFIFDILLHTFDCTSLRVQHQHKIAIKTTTAGKSPNSQKQACQLNCIVPFICYQAFGWNLKEHSSLYFAR